MSKFVWNAVKFSPAILGASLFLAGNAIAGEIPSESAATIDFQQLNEYSSELSTANNSMDVVTNVSQLRDVQPTDWAYQALDNLVNRYGCIAGYPDGTFRGNRALTRYEFAAGLNACMQQIEKLLANNGDFATKQDLATLQKLVDDFGVELATLRTRVDGLEGRVTFLENHQFSTTTKLSGEVILQLADVFGDKLAVPSAQGTPTDKLDVNTIFADRVRLALDTSFTGKDRLRTRLQARNIAQFDAGSTSLTAPRPNLTGTNMTRLGADGDDANDVTLNRLEYRFPLGSNTTAFLTATGGEFNDQVENFNPLLASSADGSITRFGRFNPIYRQAEGGAGVTINHNFSKAVTFSLGYQAAANVANNPSSTTGLFNGSYAALAQLAFKPSDSFNLGLTYVHSYYKNSVNVTGSTGSRYAQSPFGTSVPTDADHFGVQANFRVSPRFTVGGWAGYTNANRLTGSGDADIWNYAINLGFADLGKKGNLLGIVFGMPPKATSNTAGNVDRGTSYHLEGFYRYQVSNNISITPGLLVLFNPEHNSSNPTQYVGTIRTTFKF